MPSANFVPNLGAVPPPLVNPERPDDALLKRLAFDLYELHQHTGISLDNWESAREFVENYYGPLQENGV